MNPHSSAAATWSSNLFRLHGGLGSSRPYRSSAGGQLSLAPSGGRPFASPTLAAPELGLRARHPVGAVDPPLGESGRRRGLKLVL